MSDLISRQDAIDATWEEPSYTDPMNVLTEVRDRIKALPSAQPKSEERTEESAQNVPNDELISRKAAIDAVKKHYRIDNDLLEIIAYELEQLPSAQPELHYDEWCTDCKGYDQERHCCPRFNRVIRQTLDEVQAERKTGK